MTKELEDLIAEREELIFKEKEIADLIRKEQKSMTFDEWYNHGIKQDYSWIIDEKFVMARKVIENRDMQRHEVISLEGFADYLNIEEDNKNWKYMALTSYEECEQLKVELREMNFGSMEMDW